MKRPKQRPRPHRPSPAPPEKAPRRVAGPLGPLRTVLLAALMVGSLALLWWRLGPKPRAAEGLPASGLGTEQMLDSLRACVSAHEWDRALRWARAINVSRPGTASLLESRTTPSIRKAR